MAWSDYGPALGQFTATPARMIDSAYLSESKGFFARLWNLLKIRALYVFFFVPMSVIDLVASSLAAFFISFAVVFSSDEAQTQFTQQMRTYATLFSKNLFSLLAFPFGLYSPKLTAFYFIQAKQDIPGVAAGGGLHDAPLATLQSPKTIEE